MQRLFPCLIYKADNAFYQNGTYASISCNQVKIGDFGMNTYGEIVPLPYNTSPLIDTALVPEGTVFPSPTEFGDATFKKVTQVKDMDNLVTYYCDTASYNANFVHCNPGVATATSCPNISGVGVPDLDGTYATVTWANPPGAVGIEYILSQSGTVPSAGTDGTYVDGTTPTVTITGLSHSTTYNFFSRTICGRGVRGPWVFSVEFATN